MRVLYVGDIYGKLGRKTTQGILPGLIKDRQIDFVIAQGENVSHGKGMQPAHAKLLEEAGVNFFTGGNHTLVRPEILEEAKNVIRPANLPADTPGKGYQVVSTPFGKILIISLMGQTVGMPPEQTLLNPLTTVDEILKEHKAVKLAATIVNFHGDFSSEKVVIGQYLDGKVTAVISDHWHVPTADAQVLPGGTAHVTDVGMVGALDSSLGVKTEVITKRWLTGEASRNELEESGRCQFNAVLIEVVAKTHLAKSIEPVRIISQ